MSASAVIVKQATNIDTAKANAKGNEAKGHALADLCVSFAKGEVQHQIERNKARMAYVFDIANLNPEGHAVFRADLQKVLSDLSFTEKAMTESGVTKEAESEHAGYSAASFRVMVSCWRTVSVACEAGMKVSRNMTWDEVLSEARAVRKAKQDAGAALEEGQRAQGAGRKAASAYDKAFKSITTALSAKDLTDADIARIMENLAAAYGYKLSKVAAPKVEAPKVEPVLRAVASGKRTRSVVPSAPVTIPAPAMVH